LDSLQTSQGGAAYFAGKGIKNSAEKQEASVAGAIAAAHYIRSIAPLYGIPVVRTFFSLELRRKVANRPSPHGPLRQEAPALAGWHA
jgi:Fructose/tagatose bisphosphate aldolase